MLTTATKTRALANWPAAVADAMLTPHLSGAVSEFLAWVGADTYAALVAAGPTDPLRLAGEEIEGCLAIAYAIPSLNMFALAEGPTVPKEIEDLNFAMLEPEQITAMVKLWMDRARSRFDATQWTDDAGMAPRMYAV